MKGRFAIGLLFAFGGACLALAAAPSDPQEPPWIGQRLKPGEFIWKPEIAPEGPLTVVVSIPEQLAYVYRNGVAIGLSTVSTGRKGKETPAGVFTILQRKVDHESNIYKGAKMPHMQRLTWTGIALHAGRLPGYPASAGCVRLPDELAKLLYSATKIGTTVIITDGKSDTEMLNRPGLLLPIAEAGAAMPAGAFVWEPEKAPEGPFTILVSRRDGMIYAYRNGVQIGRGGIAFTQPQEPLPSAVFTLLEGETTQPSPVVQGKPMRRWLAVDLANATVDVDPAAVLARTRLAPDFAAKLYDALVPGSTLMLTDLPATRSTTTEPDFTVLVEEGAEGK